MKVKIIDSLGGQYRCDSRDPELIGRWIIEQAARLIADGEGQAPMYLYVWPADQAEQDNLGFHGGLPTNAIKLAHVLGQLIDL